MAAEEALGGLYDGGMSIEAREGKSKAGDEKEGTIARRGWW